MKILVINAGSSSLKYQLIDMTTEKAIAKGGCERIGIDGSFLKHKSPKGEVIINYPMPSHKEAIELVLSTLTSKENGVISSMNEIDAVGHRVLHSGPEFDRSVLITPSVLEIIKKNADLGPLHQIPNIMGYEACHAVMPNTPMVAVFDTAFHMTMPDYAYTYAVPYEYYTEYKVRRYGFHGTSHRYVSQVASEYLGKKDFKLITCHLGNGSSLAAIKNGKVIDTSMGLTPLAGVPMGTRSGDIDPAVVEFMCKKLNVSVSEMLNILNKKSGLAGVSGVSSDFRDLSKASSEGNDRARLTLDIFAYSIKKYIGAYAAALDGLDCLVFTAGIGENAALARRIVTNGLDYLGVKIDEAKNAERSDAPVHEIQADDSKVKVLVIPTNEELVIARDTASLVK